MVCRGVCGASFMVRYTLAALAVSRTAFLCTRAVDLVIRTGLGLFFFWGVGFRYCLPKRQPFGCKAICLFGFSRHIAKFLLDQPHFTGGFKIIIAEDMTGALHQSHLSYQLPSWERCFADRQY